MKQFLHKKIPAAPMALCLLLALCCQTLAAGRTLVPGGYTVGIKLYAEGLMVTEVEPDAPAQRRRTAARRRDPDGRRQEDRECAGAARQHPVGRADRRARGARRA